MKSSHDKSVDTLRGLACLLLASYHVIGDNPSSGLRITDGWMREVNDLLALIRMPLFTILSGYVYAMRPFEAGPGGFIRGKVRRLLIPMLIVGTAFAILQAVIPGTRSVTDHWYLLHILPVAHYWFIESLFFLFLILLPLEAWGILKKPVGFAAVFGVAAMLYLIGFGTPWFSLLGTFYLMPFFLAGLAWGRFGIRELISPARAWTALAVLAVLLAVFAYGSPPERQTVAGLLVGLVGCGALLSTGWSVPALAWVGGFSYTIYLYHVFFTAGARIALTRVGIDGISVLFLSALTAGILGPILVEWMVLKIPKLTIPLLGRKPARKRPTMV